MSRVDVRLVELGLAPSRAKAQAMIKAGEVEVRTGEAWRRAHRVSETALDARVIAGGDTLRFVSRGGLKLEHALNHVGMALIGARVLDVGQSTGGFTDCVLRHGAAAVLGVDVGHDQLHPSLRGDARVITREGVNARRLGENTEVSEWIDAGPCVVVADLSFISLTTILPALALVTRANTPGLLLVKPQFETGPKRLDGRGIVTDPRDHDDVKDVIAKALAENDFDLLDYFACAVVGQDGNQEFFAHVRRR